MSEYKRIVSYIYRYKNGEKLHNAGFARMECRQGVMRLTIQVQDKTNDREGVYEVFLYDTSGEQGIRIYLGSMNYQNHLMEFRCSSNENNIMESGTSLEHLGGIVLYYNNEIAYVTQWDDEPLNVDKLAEKTSYKEVMNKKDPESEKIVDENPKNVDKVEIKQEKDVKVSDKSTFMNEINTFLNENVDKFSSNEDNTNEILAQACRLSQQAQPKEEQLPQGIPYLLKYRSKLPDFSNHEVVQCVKIMPEDIGFMNRRNWEYGNNSFVMHGYYNYRYLLLGVMPFQDGKKQYVLGVPGIFSNKDRYLANIFRFTEFIPLRTGQQKTGEFGYWIARLAE